MSRAEPVRQGQVQISLTLDCSKMLLAPIRAALLQLTWSRWKAHGIWHRRGASTVLPAMPQVSATLFYQVAGIAWNRLSAETQQAIRQTSSAGRTLHDSNVTVMEVWLGRRKPDMLGLGRNMHLNDDGAPGAGEDGAACRAPTPGELRASLAAVRRRGARVQCLRLRFWRVGGALPPAKEREEQL